MITKLKVESAMHFISVRLKKGLDPYVLKLWISVAIFSGDLNCFNPDLSGIVLSQRTVRYHTALAQCWCNIIRS